MFDDFSGVLLIKIKPRRLLIPFNAPTIPADKRVRKMKESVSRGSEHKTFVTCLPWNRNKCIALKLQYH